MRRIALLLVFMLVGPPIFAQDLASVTVFRIVNDTVCVTWEPNQEEDMDHYVLNMYAGLNADEFFSVIIPHPQTRFVGYVPLPKYYGRIFFALQAVDHAGNKSELSKKIGTYMCRDKTVLGDTNHDLVVDVDDLSAITRRRGATCADGNPDYIEAVDLDGDCAISVDDISICIMMIGEKYAE